MENDIACTEDMVIAAYQSVDGRCGSFYKPNEKILLKDIGSKIATYECFLQKFEQWCSEYIQY